MPVLSPTDSIFSQLEIYGHKKVAYCSDPYSGLRAIIAIHDTARGPALGGTRMWAYKTESDALQDVLRLSKAMTYKSAIAGLNLGGGKAVIIGNSHKDKSEALLRKFGRFIKKLGGEFITAEDVGTNPRDMEYIRMETQYVMGVPETTGGSGDPSPITAPGVFMGIKASDINEEPLRQIAKKYGAEAISNNSIFDINADIYAPCALGATINTQTINKLKCAIIAGSANNQLNDENIHGRMLLDKGILFAPDYVSNACGIINCYSDLMGFSKKRTMQLTKNIYEATRNVLKLSGAENISTIEAAN